MFGEPPSGELWSGDDTAVVSAPAGNMLFTIDVLVEHVDFELAYSKPQHIGWKAIAVNLSDVAAMGGRPGYAVTAIWLPAEAALDVAEGIAEGIARCCSQYGVAMVGGDVSTASEIGVAIAMTGAMEQAPVTRGGARKGDLLCVTGKIGSAAAGLAALRAGRGEEFPAAVARQVRPEPRLKEGAALAAAGATAMIDLSDGLAPDLTHLTEASHVGCEVDVYALPLDRAAEEVARALGLAVLDLGVAGGEDFELLCALPPERLDAAREAMAAIGTPLTVIGRFAGNETKIAGRTLEEWKEKGWEHLRPR